MSPTSTPQPLDAKLLQTRIMPILAFAILFSVLNGVMFNVAIPDIAATFSLSPSTVSWVVSAYVVMFALGSVLYAKLAERFAIRDLISVGLGLFCLGSVVGYVGDSFAWLMIGRLIQASGASGIPALGMMLATLYAPAHLKGTVLGMFASTVAFAAGVAPLVGGFLAGNFGWKALFFLPLATLIVIPAFRRFLPREIKHPRPFDFFGATAFAVAITALLFAVTKGRWDLLLGAAAAASLFAWHIRRVSAPFLPPALFGLRRYRSGLIIVILAIAPAFAMMFAVPIMLRDVHALDTMAIGLVTFPGAMSGALAGYFAGKFSARLTPYRIVLGGIVILGSGLIALMVLHRFDPWVTALCLICGNGGFSIIHSSLANTISETLERTYTGVGMGLFNLTFFLAGALGTALAGRTLSMPLPAIPADAYAVLFGGIALVSGCAFVAFRKVFRHH